MIGLAGALAATAHSTGAACFRLWLACSLVWLVGGATTTTTASASTQMWRNGFKKFAFVPFPLQTKRPADTWQQTQQQQQQQQQQQHEQPQRRQRRRRDTIVNVAKTYNDYSQSSDTAAPCEGLYRPFATYAWERLSTCRSKEGVRDIVIPEKFRQNTASAKGPNSGNSTVQMQVQSMRVGGTEKDHPVATCRLAILETVPFEKGDDSIQVLNLVVFPNPRLVFKEEGDSLSLPILGIDLVSLPGYKHLLAIDFQPVLEKSVSLLSLLHPRYASLQAALAQSHADHFVSKNDGTLPWGGDIPEAAQRFFSNYTVWSRLAGETQQEVITTDVWNVFTAYVETYLRLLQQVHEDVQQGLVVTASPTSGKKMIAQEGLHAYLNYRRSFDPARPMLRSLYGPEWTEELIETILFPMHLAE